MAGNLNEAETMALREEAQRYQQTGPEPHPEKEFADLSERMRNVESKFEMAYGVNGATVNWPVISAGGNESFPQPQQFELVDFWRNGILVRRRMAVAGGPTTNLT